ncbi:hypothetical protein NORO109296_00305 [Nocardiopsis rhodophaea]
MVDSDEKDGDGAKAVDFRTFPMAWDARTSDMWMRYLRVVGM